MRKNQKKILTLVLAAMTLGSAMTAYAGTWEEHQYAPIVSYAEEWGSGQVSYKMFSGFSNDRAQSALVGTDWKYVKDDGAYAANEWIQDLDGRWYYLGEEGLTYSGYWTLPDGQSYFFEPSDAHMIQNAVLEIRSTGASDIAYTLYEDGSWDYADGYDGADLTYVTYRYFGESGANESGIMDSRTVNKQADENGVPYLEIGGDRYQAVRSSSMDKTEQTKVDGFTISGAYQEFYTVYQKVN